MIEGLTNILKLAYFSKLEEKPAKKKKTHPFLLKKQNYKWDIQLVDVCKLIISQQPIEHWLLQFQLHKHNYILQHQVYNAIKNKNVTIHNLFIMVIQCKVFDQNVWITIDDLCALDGGRDNELCCLVHYTVLNMGMKQSLNPEYWRMDKAKKELGNNFIKAFGKIQSLCQKVTILPMMMVLNKKNSKFLWQNLQWMLNFPINVVADLKTNLIKLLQPDYILTAEFLRDIEQNPFFRFMHKKSLILKQIEGFVSAKNLFAYSYELYNFPLLLQLLAESQFQTRLTDFVIEFLQCCEAYEFDLTKMPKDTKNLNQIVVLIIRQKLYLQEVADLFFIKETWELISDYYPTKVKNRNVTFAKIVPRCVPYKIFADETQEQEESEKMIRRLENDSILSYLLNQLYLLKTGYLQIICSIMEHCYSLEEEPWAFVNSSYYKLQFLFQKYGLLNFLIEQYAAIQSNDPETMMNYYNCLGYLIRFNPIMYGKLNQILMQYKRQANYQNKKKKRNEILLFTEGFVKNALTSRNSILIILCDQIMWSQNENKKYDNFFVQEVINKFQPEWMISLTSTIIPSLDHESQEYHWVTFLLTFYYYFYEIEIDPKNRISKEKYLDRLYEEDKGDKLIEKLDGWSNYYDKNLKNPMTKYGLCYPVLKGEKQKMVKKIRRYWKRRQFEARELPLIEKQYEGI